MQIRIPFTSQFKQAMLDGVKICTSRSKRFGEPGDTFTAFGAEFEIISVNKETLDYVAAYLWKEEGCENSWHFIRVWEEIHPIKGFDPEWKVWVHKFVKLGG